MNLEVRCIFFRIAGTVSSQKCHERGFITLVNMMESLLINGLEKAADKVDSTYSMPTVLRWTVPLTRMRTAVTELM